MVFADTLCKGHGRIMHGCMIHGGIAFACRQAPHGTAHRRCSTRSGMGLFVTP